MIPYIDYSKCEVCGACVELYPMFFEMRDGRVWVINHESFHSKDHGAVIFSCPFRAITME